MTSVFDKKRNVANKEWRDKKWCIIWDTSGLQVFESLNSRD